MLLLHTKNDNQKGIGQWTIPAYYRRLQLCTKAIFERRNSDLGADKLAKIRRRRKR
jgi:hypothetical protein